MREFFYRHIIQRIPITRWFSARSFQARLHGALFGVNTAVMEGEMQELFLTLKWLAENASDEEFMELQNTFADLYKKVKDQEAE